MKIITLIPVKNESWILRFSLKNYSIYSDEILILNDNSIDDLLTIVKDFPKVKIINFDSSNEKHVDMSRRRNILLEEGRNLGGTHFVWLDADEVFSKKACDNLVRNIKNLHPGDTLQMPWILVHQTKYGLVIDKKEKNNFKDFVHFDDRISFFEKKTLSESRTPTPSNKSHVFKFEDGCVFHFQQLAQKRNQLKQAWYRCQELIAGNRSARRINATYNFTKSIKVNNPEILNDKFIFENKDLIDHNGNSEYHLNEIKALFNEYGVRYFEELDIWHVDELNNYFIQEMNRKPIPKKFPKIILMLNDIKNIIINKIRKIKNKS